jgi:DNA modification methylase
MKYELHNTDCLGLVTEPVDLVYLDPPYSCESEDEYYGVGSSFDEFVSYMADRLNAIKKLMKKDSNIVVHMDYKAIHYVKVSMDKIFGRDSFRNEIIWGFSNPASAKRWLPRKHHTILWYGLGEYVFNQPRVPYKTKMNVGGAAAWSKEKIPWEHYEQRGKLLEDWWVDIPAICRNEPEKNGYATQKPLKLMERVVTIWSNPGDRVLDPFCGSGSFLEAALAAKRFPVGSDKNPKAIALAKQRLDVVKDIFSE